MTLSIVIQAGGQSKRMGKDKGLVSLAGKAMIEHVIEGVDGIGDEIVITTNKPQEYAFLGKRTAADANPGAGALVGLQTALEAAQSELVFIIACDMPFPNRALIQHMVSLVSQIDAVVPFVNDRYQPLHAVYRRSTCLPAVQAALARGDKRAISFYPDIQVHKIEEKEISQLAEIKRAFLNINTPDELASVENMLQQKAPNSDKI